MLPEPALTSVGVRYDRARMAALASPTDALADEIAALANSTGGFVILGADLAADTGEALALPGADEDECRSALKQACEAIDPPVDHLVSLRELRAPSNGAPVALVQVRQSPSPPHLVVPGGKVLVRTGGGLRPVQSRAELDALYSRGRAERERADRQLDAMVEKLLQSHYAFYGIGFVAATQSPTADPYLWARENAAGLIAEAGRFAATWELTPEMVKMRPGDVEVRNEGDVFGYIRLTRAGAVAVGEVRRRPPGNTLGSVQEVLGRVGAMIELGAALLGRAQGATVVPRLFFEGLRSQRLIVGTQPYAESSPVEPDTAQLPGNLGAADDPEYRRRLAGELSSHLLSFFRVAIDFDDAALPDDV